MDRKQTIDELLQEEADAISMLRGQEYIPAILCNPKNKDKPKKPKRNKK